MREGTPRPDAPVVVGIGAVSPAGVGTRPLWRAVTTGAITTGRVSRFDLSGYPTDHVGEVSAADLDRLDSIVPAHPSLAGRFFAAAALEAMRRAGLDPRHPGGRVGVFAGTVMGVRPVLDRGIKSGVVTVTSTDWSRPDGMLDVLHEVIDVDGPSVLAAPGCSAGNSAIALGASAISAGEVDLAICGGADELSHEVFAMFTSLRGLAPDVIRPFDANRAGTMPSEGAGVLLLAHPASVASPAAQPLAALLSHGEGADAYHMTHPRPDGAAIVASIAACLRAAGLSPDDVDWVCAHGTGTRASDGVEATAIATALAGGTRRPVVSSIKGMLGHTVGAAAALEAIVGVLALAYGFIPGNPTLRRPDPACEDIDLVPADGREGPVKTVLSPSFGFGGGVSTIALGGLPGTRIYYG
jgi:3-oxoacyl-(acyl-carrier-protein) synthase